MKAALFSLVGLLAGHPAAAQGLPAGRALPPADEAAIRWVVQRLNANHNDHHFGDLATYATADLSLVNVAGEWLRVRRRVQAAFQTAFDRFPAGTTFAFGAPVIRAVAPGAAIVNQTYWMGARHPPDGGPRGGTQNLITLVLVKQQGRWLLTAGQGTAVAATPALDHSAPAN